MRGEGGTELRGCLRIRARTIGTKEDREREMNTVPVSKSEQIKRDTTLCYERVLYHPSFNLNNATKSSPFGGPQ